MSGPEGTMAMEKVRRWPQNLRRGGAGQRRHARDIGSVGEAVTHWRWKQSLTSFMTNACAPLPAFAS